MGITFTATPTATTAPASYVVTCGCEDATVRAPRYGTYDDAVAEAAKANRRPRCALPGCWFPEICPEYPLRAEEVDPDGPVPAVDICYGNIPVVLTALALPVNPDNELAVLDMAPEDAILPPPEPVDFEEALSALPEIYGEMPAADFQARTLTALALAPADAGTPTIRDGSWIHVGRSEGYLQRRLTDLHDLAAWCARHARNVRWA